MIQEGLLFIIVALGVAYICMLYLYHVPDYDTPSAHPLSQSISNFMSMNPSTYTGVWASAQPCSIRFFVYVESISRSLDTFECDSTVPIPGCSGYNQAIHCTSDCVNETSKFNTSYLKSIFRIGDGAASPLDFSIQGYSSTSTKERVPAYLRILTQRDPSMNSLFIEGVSLPVLPLQSWVMVTIQKSGKRIDVFYNKTRVASQVLTYVPMDVSPSSYYSTGHPEVKGTIGFGKWSTILYNEDSMEQLYTRLTDLRGRPRILDHITFSLPSIKICAFGSCNPMPTVAPANPFQIWKSSYN